MRPYILLALSAAAVAAGQARAQTPAPRPLADYTTTRAYAHFLTSPSGYRTYTGSAPGYTPSGYSPAAFERINYDRVYLHVWITPDGQQHIRAEPRSPGAAGPAVDRGSAAP